MGMFEGYSPGESSPLQTAVQQWTNSSKYVNPYSQSQEEERQKRAAQDAANIAALKLANPGGKTMAEIDSAGKTYTPLFYNPNDNNDKKYTYTPPAIVPTPAPTPTLAPAPQNTGILGFLGNLFSKAQVAPPLSKYNPSPEQTPTITPIQTIQKLFPQVEPPASKLSLGNTDDTIKGDGFWGKIRTVEDNVGNNLAASPLYNGVANSLPVKVVNRMAYSAANAQTGGQAVGSNPDLGGIGNFAADNAGYVLSLLMPNAGLGGMSINNALSPVGNLAENAVSKGLNKIGPVLPMAVNKVANYTLPTAARGAAEFGLYGGANNAVQGKDVLQGAEEGALNGALFNVGGKALGSAADNLLKNGLVKTTVTESKLTPENPLNKLIPNGAKISLNQDKGSNLLDNLNPLLKADINNGVTDTGNALIPSIGANDRTHSIQQIVSSDSNKNNLSLLDKLKNTGSDLYNHYVDINNPIKNVDMGTYIAATNSKKVGGTVSHIIDNNLVDMEGNKIGEGLKNIVKDIPAGQKDDFLNYVLQRHNIDRAKEISHTEPVIDNQGFIVTDKNGAAKTKTVVDKESKPVYKDFTSEQSGKAVKLIEQQHPEYKALNDRLVGFVNKFMDTWGNKSGLIPDDVWKSLQDSYKNYVPTQRQFEPLEQGIQRTNGRGFVDQSNPLMKASGSERDIIDPIENIMNMINKTVRTARYNEVGQKMLGAIRNDPEGMAKYAEIIPEGTDISPNVKNVVTVLENGSPVNVQINDKNLLESLQGINKSTELSDVQKKMQKVTQGYKGLITTKNPLFALKNVARDIPTAYVNGSEKNPVTFIGDLIKAGKDIATNSENMQKYSALGGKMSNFFSSDEAAKAAKDLTKNPNIFQKGLNKVEALNNTMETAPRLAEFNRSLKQGDSPQQALYNAGEVTTNFSRGGDRTKYWDSFLVPYLNASIQGLDKTARQLKEHPLATTAKGITSVTVPTLAFDYLNRNNDNYKQLDNRTKDNYYLIPNGDTFIKVPKSREIGVLFGSLAERALRAANGEKDSFKGFGNTVATNVAPTNPIENNLLSPLTLNLMSNKDYAGRTIVPQSIANRSPALQYDDTTSEIGKKLGELAGLSPKQIDYAIKSYTGVLGQIGLPVATAKTYQGNAKGNLLSPLTQQFTADPLYSNQNITDFYDNMNKTKAAAADKNFLQNIDSKVTTHEEYVANAFTKASQNISDLTKQVNEANKAGDAAKVKSLRQQIINTASEANSLYDNGTTPPGELKAQIDNQIKYNTGANATIIRNKADQIIKSNQSSADQSQLLQQLLDGAANMKQGKAPKKKAEKPNPYNK